MSFLRKNEVILFQGDSITDCGRNRDDITSLGGGYPYHIAAWLSAACLENEFVFINKAVSGDRVCDLYARWDADCIALKPTVVSILIGINDTWRRYDSNDPTDVEAFINRYRHIVTRAVNESNARIIIMEPFLLPVYEEQKQWREDLDPKINAIRGLAREFNAVYIPLDGIFTAAYMKKSPAFWAHDGVHPSTAGHGLIAQSWINAVNAL